MFLELPPARNHAQGIKMLPAGLLQIKNGTYSVEVKPNGDLWIMFHKVSDVIVSNYNEYQKDLISFETSTSSVVGSLCFE